MSSLPLLAVFAIMVVLAGVAAWRDRGGRWRQLGIRRRK